MSNIQLTIPGFSAQLLAFRTELTAKENPNTIINGNFDIWQRNTSFTNPTNNQYLADRFKILHNGSGTRSITRQPFNTADRIPSVTFGHPTYYLRYLKNTIGTGVDNPSGAADVIQQPVEGIMTLSGPVTFSFWVRASANTTISPFLNQFGLGGASNSRCYTKVGLGSQGEFSAVDWTQAYSVSLTANVWTQISFSCVLDSNFGIDSLSFPAAHGIGVNIALPNTAFINYDITSVSLEKGSIATTKNPNSVQQELTACLRYYETIVASVASYVTSPPAIVTSFCNFRQIKRATPTLVNLGDIASVGSGVASTPAISSSGFNFAVTFSAGGVLVKVTSFSADSEF